jgi:hypothetical protein
MKAFFFFISFFLLNGVANAQYPPQAGLPGSTAISATSGQFVAWATQCIVQRGYRNIAIPDSGYASLGDSSLATGPADDNVVSLGDSGVAILTFSNPIIDGPGADFAVFENGFIDGANPALAFLELGFVEVSSDGINYYRFPATSLTQDTVQIGNGNYMDASKLNNLAGKYIARYGTPFDLQELSGTGGLDINNITHVRIIDVVGSIGAHASHDSAGRVINDPYPTPFASCGFDLDAVGVIHQSGTGVVSVADDVSVNTYPNPASDDVVISIKGVLPEGLSATLGTITGYKLQEFPLLQNVNTITIRQYPAGMYYLTLRDANGNKWVEKLIKR